MSLESNITGYTVDLEREWFAAAHALDSAVFAIKQERMTGHITLDLTHEQVQQRQAILQIAEDILTVRMRKAFHNFHNLRRIASEQESAALDAGG